MKVYQKKKDMSRVRAFLLILWLGFLFGCLYLLGEVLFWGTDIFPFAWLYIVPFSAGVLYQAVRLFVRAVRRARRPRRLGMISREVLLEVLSR